jgi:hypothetical protein
VFQPNNNLWGSRDVGLLLDWVLLDWTVQPTKHPVQNCDRVPKIPEEKTFTNMRARGLRSSVFALDDDLMLTLIIIKELARIKFHYCGSSEITIPSKFN